MVQMVLVDYLGVEFGHFRWGGQGMAQHNPIGQSGGQGLRKQELSHGLANLPGLWTIGLFQAGTQASHGVAVGLGNGFVENLAKGVIAEQQMNALGKGLLQAKGPLKQAEGETVLSESPGLVEQLVENQMALGVLGQSGETDDFVEVSLVAVQVAGHNDFTASGKLQKLALAAGVGQVSLAVLVIKLNNGLLG